MPQRFYFQTSGLYRLLAALCLALPFAGPLQAQHALIAQDDAAYSHERMVEQWRQRTQGRNLAQGRPVAYDPTPTYHLTVRGDSDIHDLTDGVLATGEHSDVRDEQVRRHNQMIWFSPQAVGWARIVSPVNRITIDLGETQPVDRVVWRVVAGSVKRGFQGPASVRLYGSDDGKTMRLLQERHRWREDIATPGAYKLPNLGPVDTGDRVYVYPLSLDAGGYPVRHLTLEFEMDTHWMTSDELAVIAATGRVRSEADFRKLPVEELQVRDVWIAAPRDRLPVVRDLRLPMWFRQSDLRPADQRNTPVTYHFTLPDGVTLHAPRHYKAAVSEDGRSVQVTAHTGGNTKSVGPFFLEADQGLPQPAQMTYHAQGQAADAQPARTITLYEDTLPAPFKLEQLTVSIGWMADHRREQWIDFARHYTRLGFNTVPSMPRGWWDERKPQANLTHDAIHQSDQPQTLTVQGRQLAAMRQAGLKVVYMESPFHVINWRYPDHAGEFRHQLSTSTPAADGFCATYRGPFYDQEVRRIGESFLLMGGADYIMWDCEFIGSALHAGKTCSRCQAALKASGMALEPFMRKQWADAFITLNTLVLDLAKERGWPQPKLGMYGVQAIHPYANLMVYGNRKVGYDFQNPSMYVGQHDEVVHRTVRQARQATGRNDIIPWLSTRTGGQVDPPLVKVILWEAFLNGSRGVTYYHLGDFDPAQLVAVAQALAAIAPHEDMIVHGEPAHDRFKVTSGQGRLSAVTRGDQALLLVVNPTDQPQAVAWQGPWNSSGQVELAPREGRLVPVGRP